MNVYFFKLFKIDYAYVLTLDLVKEREADHKDGIDGDSTERIGGPNGKRHNNTSSDEDVTAGKLVVFSLSLLLLLHISTEIWIEVLQGSTIGAIFAFYTAAIVGIALPLSSTAWIRSSVGICLHRALELVNPRCFFCFSSGMPRAVPFVDVFFADAMCSLSKVFFDWGMLWHLALHYPNPVPMDLEYIVIPSIAASIPYLIRARQCIVMHSIGKMKNDPRRYQHMLNAVKYSTSLWPLLVSVYQKTADSESSKQNAETLLIVLFVINSTYSLAWDVIMDWGMMQNPQNFAPECAGAPAIGAATGTRQQTCAQAVLRPKLRYGASASIAILIADTVLRYSWLLRFYEKGIFPSTDVYILCSQFLEAIRRALWNLLRVEWESIKQKKAAGKEDELEMAEQQSFLPSPSSMNMQHRIASKP